MFENKSEYELYLNNDYDFLYKNLMEEPTEKNKDKDETDIYSHKREDLIDQMLMDKLNLSKNVDNRFVKGRTIYYYDISFISEIKNKIKHFIKIKTQKNMNFDFDVTIDNETFNYSIFINDKNVKVNRNPNKVDEEENTERRIQNQNEKSEEIFEIDTTKASKDDLQMKEEIKNNDGSNRSTSSILDNNQNNKPIQLKSVRNSEFNEKFDIKKEDECFYFRIVTDIINGITYYLVIDLKLHEVDGNLQSNEIIDLKKELGDILFYPKKEIIKIEKNAKILIEVKQNAPLRTIFGQMKVLMNDLKIILPNEKYCYFGFVNKIESLNESDEKVLIDEIKKYEEENGYFKIFLFIVENNKIFDLELSDNIDYALHFRNELNKKIDAKFGEIKDEIKDMRVEMKNEIDGLIKLIMELKQNYVDKKTNENKP